MLFPLSIPPGVYRNGTEYQSKGRFYDMNLCRWIDDALKPIGGWVNKTTSVVTGSARALLPWKDNSALTWLGIGTHSRLYVANRAGAVFNITPAGFATGFADSTIGGGYGGGAYGVGTYGTPRPDATLIQDASVWTLDTWGEYLVGIMADDGKAYQWTLNTAVVAAQIAGSPTGRALVVTNERSLMILGANGNPRKVQWSDLEDNTDWTPTSTNQAGSINLQTSGRLMCGRVIKGGVLLFTDVDAHLMTYTGDVFVYRPEKIGSGCGIASQNAAASIDSQAVWMGRNSFWFYNGYVQQLHGDVDDYVFSDINLYQIAKVTCFRSATYNEVWWFYPSQSATENNRYVVYNYVTNKWAIGALERLAGCDRGVFTYPSMVDSTGQVYDHETGFSYSSLTPYAEGGPLELGSGDNVMHALSMIPDEKTAGDVTVTFKVKFYPNGAETTFGPYSAANPIDLRFVGRQVKVRYDGVTSSDWRVGSNRLDLRLGGLR